MKRGFALLLTTMLVLLLWIETSAEQKTIYKVGICQLEQHAALEEATRGFMDSITQQLGNAVTVDVRHASGDTATCITIVNAFLAEEVDLILANSTQALQAASAATGDTPILGVSVTDYPAALDMDHWEGVTEINVSGTSDLAPLDAQAELIRAMFPDAKQVGLLYCSSEVNSQYQARMIRRHLETMGYACEEYTFTDTNDVFMMAQNACQYSDVIFVPTDNTIAACTELLLNVVEMEKVPIIGGDRGICAGCGVATICIDYYDLGYTTGQMACKVLGGEAEVPQMPIEYASVFHPLVNPVMCELLGIAVPENCELMPE